MTFLKIYKIFSGKNKYRWKIESFFQIEWFKGANLLEWKNLGTKRWKEIAILSPIPFFFFFSETIYYVFIIRIILLFLKIETFCLTFSYFEIKIFENILIKKKYSLSKFV